MFYENDRQRDFFWGALVGGTVATLTALLFTTKKGKQIQNKVGDIYHSVEEGMIEKVSDAKEKIEEGVDHLGKKISQKTKND
jgi:gas vesicle protein